MKLVGSLILVTLSLVFASAAASQEFPVNPQQSEAVLALIQDNREINRHYRMCPADIFNTVESNIQPDVEGRDYSEFCAHDPQECLKQCMNGRDASICFELAYVLEDNNTKIAPRFGQMLFAQACAGGWALGCTNRGAGIRNGQYEGDPFEDIEANAIDACLNRTFETACSEKDGWGCFMIGQSYEYGEGRETDPAKAKEFYAKVCQVEPDNEDACESAKSAISYMD